MNDVSFRQSVKLGQILRETKATRAAELESIIWRRDAYRMAIKQTVEELLGRNAQSIPGIAAGDSSSW